jgi:site-specific DNA-methyltransferase (adenine-specific)
MSIDAAFNLVKNFKKTEDERNEPNALEEIHLQGEKNWFRLINKTCMDLSDLQDESITTVIFSPPYWVQRVYPEGVNLDGLKLGEEPSSDLYIENSVRIYQNLKRVLKKNGNLFINIAESYSDGVCANVISKLIIAMEKDGWSLVQNLIWAKKNPKPVGGKIDRLRPSTEVILHFALDKIDRFYKPFRMWDRDSQITLQGGCNDEIEGDKKQKKKKYSLDKPVISFTDFLDEQKVAGVISGSVVNKSQLKKIDSEFNHIAPSPEYIAAIPVLTTSVAGQDDTILDIFCGTSSLLAFALRSGRNVIGYDTDPRSIEFSKKRLQSILDDQFSDSEIEEIQTNYLIAA